MTTARASRRRCSRSRRRASGPTVNILGSAQKYAKLTRKLLLCAHGRAPGSRNRYSAQYGEVCLGVVVVMLGGFGGYIYLRVCACTHREREKE